MKYRITKQLWDFLQKQPLTLYEKTFILGCMRAQSKFPQLTTAQWKTVMDIKKRYTDGQSE